MLPRLSGRVFGAVRMPACISLASPAVWRFQKSRVVEQFANLLAFFGHGAQHLRRDVIPRRVLHNPGHRGRRRPLRSVRCAKPDARVHAACAVPTSASFLTSTHPIGTARAHYLVKAGRHCPPGESAPAWPKKNSQHGLWWAFGSFEAGHSERAGLIQHVHSSQNFFAECRTGGDYQVFPLCGSRLMSFNF